MGRLSDALRGLNSAGSPTVTAAYDLYQTALQRTSFALNPVGKSNGSIGSVSDTGQAITTFASPTSPAPLFYSSGTITNTPAAGTNSAGYLQVAMPSDIRRVGAEVSWPTNATGAVAIVIPSAAWSTGVLPNAGFHLTLYGNGIWTLVRFTTGGSTTIATDQTNGRFSTVWGQGLKPLDIFLDAANSTATIIFPDGTTTTITSSYFNTETANYAIWELYAGNGSSDVPASFGKLWCDTQAEQRDSRLATPLRTLVTPYSGAVAMYNVSGTLICDLSKAPIHVATLVGNLTFFSIGNATNWRQEIEIHLVQDATGSRTLSGAFSGFRWAGGSAPTLSTGANRRDIFRFRALGSSLIYYETSRSMNVG